MLEALGIYTYHSETGKITLTSFAQRDKLKPNEPNQLYYLEKNYLSGSAFDLEPDRIAFKEEIIEYHYVQRNKKYEMILAIVSRDPLEIVEITRLFINMIHIQRKENNPSTTLQSLIENPLLKEELVINKINKTTEETQEIMIGNIDILLDRGEKLDAVLDTAKNCHKNSIKLEDIAKQASRCMPNCW